MYITSEVVKIMHSLFRRKNSNSGAMGLLGIIVVVVLVLIVLGFFGYI
jgi:hypothetical protein